MKVFLRTKIFPLDRQHSAGFQRFGRPSGKEGKVGGWKVVKLVIRAQLLVFQSPINVAAKVSVPPMVWYSVVQRGTVWYSVPPIVWYSVTAWYSVIQCGTAACHPCCRGKKESQRLLTAKQSLLCLWFVFCILHFAFCILYFVLYPFTESFRCLYVNFETIGDTHKLNSTTLWSLSSCQNYIFPFLHFAFFMLLWKTELLWPYYRHHSKNFQERYMLSVPIYFHFKCWAFNSDPEVLFHNKLLLLWLGMAVVFPP